MRGDPPSFLHSILTSIPVLTPSLILTLQTISMNCPSTSVVGSTSPVDIETSGVGTVIIHQLSLIM